MHNEEETHKNRPHGPNRGSAEHAKNFGKAISRLFSEIGKYKAKIIISLILASLGAVLSIFAPNRLSNLTDEIQKGLVVNKDNLVEISKNITSSLSEEKMKDIVINGLTINISPETIYKVNYSEEISDEEKQKFNLFLDDMKKDNSIDKVLSLSPNIQNIILPTSKYKDITLNTQDKLNIIDFISKLKTREFLDLEINEKLAEVIFTDFKIDGITITALDQADYLVSMGNVTEKTSPEDLYKKIDDAPISIQNAVKPKMNMSKIKKITLFLASIYILSALFTYIESILMTLVSNNFARDLRNNISNKINKLPLKYFDKNQSGDVMSRVTNDVDTIAQTMNQSLSTLVSAITLFVGTIIMMFYTNYILAFTAIASSIIGFGLMILILGKSQKYFDARQRELGKLNSHIEEVYGSLNVVKAYNASSEVDKKFDLYNKKVYDANRKSQFLSGLMHPLMGFIGNFGYVAVCVVGAILTMNNVITFGVIIAFMTYVRLFTSPLTQIAQVLNSLQSTAAASERVFEFMDEEEMKEIENSEILDISDAKGNIEFKNVSFRYDGNESDTIKNFNAKVKAGQKIAIVGPTGAGKTTMVNLLMKFYDIEKGDIIIDGKSIKKLNRENIHDLFTMVLQDTWLFDGTVKENIIYNRKNVSDETIKEICKEIGIHHLIKTFPKGYDSNLNENDSVSSGEKQLLTIARAMINKTPFLILDEATSNVDTRTEELVQKAMDKLMDGKTSFIIAHRLSTIKNADLILVMDEGNIVEQGTHNQLIKKNGFYAKLYNSQFEL